MIVPIQSGKSLACRPSRRRSASSGSHGSRAGCDACPTRLLVVAGAIAPAPRSRRDGRPHAARHRRQSQRGLRRDAKVVLAALISAPATSCAARGAGGRETSRSSGDALSLRDRGRVHRPAVRRQPARRAARCARPRRRADAEDRARVQSLRDRVRAAARCAGAHPQAAHLHADDRGAVRRPPDRRHRAGAGPAGRSAAAGREHAHRVRGRCWAGAGDDHGTARPGDLRPAERAAGARASGRAARLHWSPRRCR